MNSYPRFYACQMRPSTSTYGWCFANFYLFKFNRHNQQPLFGWSDWFMQASVQLHHGQVYIPVHWRWTAHVDSPPYHYNDSRYQRIANTGGTTQTATQSWTLVWEIPLHVTCPQHKVEEGFYVRLQELCLWDTILINLRYDRLPWLAYLLIRRNYRNRSKEFLLKYRAKIISVLLTEKARPFPLDNAVFGIFGYTSFTPVCYS
jgi:hypothetical protein